ncbi:MAG: transposase [Alphaproteobacteria bacterium]
MPVQSNRTTSVIMDNAAFHKSNKTKVLIEEKGAVLLFLPPYSPELNPIENDFGALKKNRQYNNDKSIDDIIKAYN